MFLYTMVIYVQKNVKCQEIRVGNLIAHMRATSYTRLRARDHCTSSTLIGGEGKVGSNKAIECKMDAKYT